jgi:hypothetical protein
MYASVLFVMEIDNTAMPVSESYEMASNKEI